jgi:exoribonuclease II
MRLYLRLIHLPLSDDVASLIEENLRNSLNSIVEVRTIDSISEHPKGGFAVELQVDEESIGNISDYLESKGFRGVL